MEKRKAEIESTKKVCQFLCSMFPNFFEIKDYMHPVLGACTSLMLITYNTQIDLTNILKISISFELNRITILSDRPNSIFTFNKFMKDETVV